MLKKNIDIKLPVGFMKGNTVGINLSPLILSCEKNKGVTINAYKKLINYKLRPKARAIFLTSSISSENDSKVRVCSGSQDDS